MSSFSLLLPLLVAQLVAGYSFELASAPTQCGQLQLNLTGGTGTPPYTALVVPFGASPVNPEVRVVFSHKFNDTSTSFQLPYPGNSGFVIAVRVFLYLLRIRSCQLTYFGLIGRRCKWRWYRRNQHSDLRAVL